MTSSAARSDMPPIQPATRSATRSVSRSAQPPNQPLDPSPVPLSHSLRHPHRSATLSAQPLSRRPIGVCTSLFSAGGAFRPALLPYKKSPGAIILHRGLTHLRIARRAQYASFDQSPIRSSPSSSIHGTVRMSSVVSSSTSASVRSAASPFTNSTSSTRLTESWYDA